MYIIIIGAGPVGSSLVNLACQDGHKVAVIESSEELAQKTLEKYDVQVFHAGIEEGGIFDEVNADTADVLIATTSDDSVNLMAMFLGKEKGIPHLISMVNQTEHQGLFKKLDVKTLLNPEMIIAKSLYNFLPN
jgi:trk system potassium uptake protein TrkA